MKTLLLASSLLAILAAPHFALAKNSYASSQCASWFSKLDRNRDGALSVGEGSERFLAKITLANEDKNSSYVMQRAFFISECSIGSLGKPTL